MKRLIVLALLSAAGFLGYKYYETGRIEIPGLSAIFTQTPALPTKDDKGNPLIPCPTCGATGQVKCTAPRCKEGKVPCPGKCLKASDFRERWPQPVSGHSPDELWAVFRNGRETRAVAKNHMGEVIEVTSTEIRNLGTCPICNGQTVVDCKVCSGTGFVTCPRCRGKMVVPAPTIRATPSPIKPPARPSNPTAQQAPEPTQAIRFKDGRTIQGRIIIRDGAITVIRTKDGQTLQVQTADLAPSPEIRP